jgi:hypothetical protein
MTERSTARALVVTPDRHVLLISMAFPWRDRPIWIAPGGGLLPGETWEEAGHVARGVGPKLWERYLDIHHDGQYTRLHERYFLVRAARFEPEPGDHEAHEQSWFRAFRWWPIAALASDAAVEAGASLQAVLTPSYRSA